LAVADEIVDLYSSILNGVLDRYSGMIGGEPVDLLVGPALKRARQEHTFLEAVDVKGGRLTAEEISVDIEVIKNGFNFLTKNLVDSLGYVFGRDEVIMEARSVYKGLYQEKEELILEAKIPDDLPAFLSEEIWEEV